MSALAQSRIPRASRPQAAEAEVAAPGAATDNSVMIERMRAEQGGNGPFGSSLLNAALSEAFGEDLGGLSASFGEDQDNASIGADASTEGADMSFGAALSEDPTDRVAMEVVAHETAHALAGGGSGATALDEEGDPGEAAADRAGQGFADWMASGMEGPAPKLEPARGGKAEVHRHASGGGVKVQPGDSLWAVAKRALGDGGRWAEIASANGLRAPYVIHPGQVLKLPGASAPASAPAAPAPAPAASGGGSYTVRSGDTLSGIAAKQLGDAGRWSEIARANGLKSPYTIYPNQRLVLPGAAAPSTTPAPAADTGPAPSAPGPQGEEDLGAKDQVSLNGLSGLDRAMAVIHNEKGGYVGRKAGQLGVDASAIAAVLQVESGGDGFRDGKMVLRFENHIFWNQWGSARPSTFDKHFQYGSPTWTDHKFRDDPAGRWQSFHGNQSMEHRVLAFARGLDDEKALRSISMGAGQVMGFNFATLGYKSAADMYEAMTSSLGSQLDGMFTFIEKNSLCMRGLRSGNWYDFAKGYNGAGNAATYESLLQAAAAAYRRVVR